MSGSGPVFPGPEDLPNSSTVLDASLGDSSGIDHRQAHVRDLIAAYCQSYPKLGAAFDRALLEHLITSGHATVSEVEIVAGVPRTGDLTQPPWDETQRQQVSSAIRSFVQRYMDAGAVTSILDRVIELVHEDSLVAYVLNREGNEIDREELRRRLEDFCEDPEKERQLDPARKDELVVRLARVLFNEDDRNLENVRKYFGISDFNQVVQRIIADGKVGKVGGKSAQLLLAHRILEVREKELDEADSLRKSERTRVVIPKSRFVTTSVIEQTIDFNSFPYRHYKWGTLGDIQGLYDSVQQSFQNALIPPTTETQLRRLLEDFGEGCPLVIRSTSELEDSYENPFAGIYSTQIFPNLHGNLDERVQMLWRTMGKVFAGVWSPQAIEYRRVTGLLSRDEKMGILVQKYEGMKVGKYFLPLISMVAFSRSPLPTASPEEKAGIFARIGLGGGDCVVAGGSNGVRIFWGARPKAVIGVDELSGCQKLISVINRETGQEEKITIYDLLQQPDLPVGVLSSIVSSYDNNDRVLRPGYYGVGAKVITFNYFLSDSDFAQQITDRVKYLESVLGYPVDTEWTTDGKGRLVLLQCRRQQLDDGGVTVDLPADLEPQDIAFRFNNPMVGNSHTTDISKIVYIDSEAYGALSPDLKKKVGPIITALNHHYRNYRMIMVGAGRWGNTNDIRLGMEVEFDGISNALALLEIHDIHTNTEPSYGRHFDVNLQARKIKFLWVKMDDPKQKVFFTSAPNALESTLDSLETSPEVRKSLELPEIKACIKVIDVAAMGNGRLLTLNANGDNGEVALYWRFTEPSSAVA